MLARWLGLLRALTYIYWYLLHFWAGAQDQLKDQAADVACTSWNVSCEQQSILEVGGSKPQFGLRGHLCLTSDAC